MGNDRPNRQEGLDLASSYRVYNNNPKKERADKLLFGAMLREPYNLANFLQQLPRPALAASRTYGKGFLAMLDAFSRSGRYSYAEIQRAFDGQQVFVSAIAAEDVDVDLSWAVDEWWHQHCIWAECVAYEQATAQSTWDVAGAEAMRAKVEQLREELGANGLIEKENHSEVFAEAAMAKLDGKEPVYKTQPHCLALREFIKYFEPGTLTIIGGRPSMGKTQFALNLWSYFLDSGARGLFVSAEMASKALLNRMLGIRHGINPIGDWSTLDRGKVEGAIHEVATLDSWINDKALAIEEIESIVSTAFYTGKIDFLIVDYLQLISTNQRRQNREGEVSHISRTLVKIAKRASIPVIALAQLSRLVESRGGSKRPVPSDLRESGSLEQDADKIIFPWRPEFYGIFEDEAGNSLKGKAELIVAKNRNGNVGTAICDYDPIRGFRDPKPQQPFSPVAPGFDTVDYSAARPKLDAEDIPF